MIEPLSAWAAERTHRALGQTTDKAARLAIALGSVRSVVRVVDRHLPPMVVDWARVDEEEVVRSMSYSDLRGGHIFINPLPILDGRIDHGRALDVVCGFGLHEASHSQESRDRFEVLFKREPLPDPKTDEEHRDRQRLVADARTIFDKVTGKPTREVPAFEPMRVAAYVWNVVEDVRIEQETTYDWPGFGPYFVSVLDYMWTDMLDRHELPTEYGPDLKEKLKVVFLACRYPAEANNLPEACAPEVDWWRKWQADYLTDRVDTATTIQLALDHLAEDFSTHEEMANMAAEERAERERGEKVRAQLERLMREGIPGAYGVCITADGETIELDAQTAEAVDNLIREGLVEVNTIVRSHGAANLPIRVRRPTETFSSQRAYVGKPDATTNALRNALVFRNSVPRHDVKLLKSGTVDDEELYRWGIGDYRVFSEHVVESKPDVLMGLLVDISGSMQHGSKLPIAQRLAQLLVWATHDQEGITTSVWAHTADEFVADVYRIWSPGDPLSRLGLISALPHADNADGHAISLVAKEMMDEEQPEKVLIVLSDGMPQASGYGNDPAIAHVRSVTRWAAARGVRVVQIAIDPYDLRMNEQAAMFGPENVIGFEDEASLPRQLTNVIGAYL